MLAIEITQKNPKVRRERCNRKNVLEENVQAEVSASDIVFLSNYVNYYPFIRLRDTYIT